MVINLYDILSVPGKVVRMQATFDANKVKLQGEEFEVKAEDAFEIELKYKEKDVVQVLFDVNVVAQRKCSRCLEVVSCNYDLHVNRTIHVAKKEAYTDNSGEYDEISYIEDCNLDVDLLVLDELYTKVPMKVLCKQDCKGICKVCGINLNKSTCDCDQTVPDPRMAVFSDIFKEFKEV